MLQRNGKNSEYGYYNRTMYQTSRLDIIAANHPQGVVRCCQCVLEKWLDTNTGATWNQLIEALKSPGVQLDYFAGKLEQMLSPKCKICSNIIICSYILHSLALYSLVGQTLIVTGFEKSHIQN